MREIYAADAGPPTQLTGWGQPVGSINGADAQQLVELDVPAPARFYLIWFTTLSTNDSGEGIVEVSDVALSGT